MPSSVTLRANGLATSTNQLAVPEGSLVEATNVTIQQNIVSPRRGFRLYGNAFGSSSDTAKQILDYRDRLLRHFNTTLQFDNGSGTFTSFADEIEEAQAGLRIKSIVTNGNLYLTTAAGIQKISAASASQFSSASGFITPAGAPKALNLQASLNVQLGEQTEWFTEDSVVAYRVLWGQRDANNNLILGTPSERFEIYNKLVELLIKDTNNFLQTLDAAAGIPTGGVAFSGTAYSALLLPANSSANDVLTNLIAANAQLTTDTANPAYAAITAPSAPSTPPTNAQLKNIQKYLDDNLIALRAQPGLNAGQQALVDALDITTSTTVNLRFLIPFNVNSNTFYQVYRTPITTAVNTDVIDDLSAGDEMVLAYEDYPTQAQLDAGIVTLEDITPDGFLGANLYTNQSTGEGILQANDPPPFALDINRFKNSVFYANTKTAQKKTLQLLGISRYLSEVGSAAGVKLTIATDSDFHTYTLVNGVAEETTIDMTSVAGLAAGDYFLIDSPTQGYYVYYLVSTGSAYTGTDPAIAGRIGIAVNLPSGFTATDARSATRDALEAFVGNVFTSQISGTDLIVTCAEFGETADAEDGALPTGFGFLTTVQGVGEKATQQVSTITAVAGTNYVSTGTADYFTINTPFSKQQYYVWFKRGTATDPGITGKQGLEVIITGSETAAQAADKIVQALNDTEKFTASALSNVVTAATVDFGPTIAITENVADGGFSVSTTTNGALDVLVYDLVSPSQSTEQTALSLVSVINKNMASAASAYYISQPGSSPGLMLFQAKSLATGLIYFSANSTNFGNSFNPLITPDTTGITISAANPAVVTTPTAHGLENLDQVIISGSVGNPNADGVHTITVLSPTTFSIPVHTLSSSAYGAYTALVNTEVSENERKINRVYYSKTNQPDAVPLLNYFDVGADDKAILRIYPLRDTLFVFKEDGLYRISGESPPFNLALFDSSCVLLAADSPGVVENTLFCWTRRGISAVSEAGVSPEISKPIEDKVLKLSTVNYPSFKAATFGLGYESDQSYYVWTVDGTEDTLATICYRYSTDSRAWTIFDKTNTCGIINPLDDKLYLGAGDINYIEEERKTFSRLDQADREYQTLITAGNFTGTTIKLPSVTNLKVGDSFTQEQTLTVYKFNALLERLDADPGVTSNDYLSTLQAVAGDNMRSKLVALAQKLDADGLGYTDYESTIDTKSGTVTSNTAASPTVITSAAHGLLNGRKVLIASSNSSPEIDGSFYATVLSANTFSIPFSVTVPGTAGTWGTVDSDFEDLRICYNAVIDKLNTDSAVAYTNYTTITTTTLFEAVITNLDVPTKTITLNLNLDYILGDAVVYSAIESFFTYCPQTFDDPVNWKHFREVTVMFQNKAFTSAAVTFSTDLLPEQVQVDFNGDGNGIFGHIVNYGDGFFGGASHGAPFRTYVPLNCMRCRYLNLGFKHAIAREGYQVYGVTLTGENAQTTRAYRG